MFDERKMFFYYFFMMGCILLYTPHVGGILFFILFTKFQSNAKNPSKCVVRHKILIDFFIQHI